MTQTEIIAKRKELEAKMKKANLEIEHIRVDFEHLQLECEHPFKYTYTDMSGTSCVNCDDCGFNQ